MARVPLPVGAYPRKRADLHRRRRRTYDSYGRDGPVLYAGYLFFGFALISIVWKENMWVIQRLGILANGTLYATTLLTMILGKPFTADYAKADVPPEMWQSGGFIRSCYMTTSVWSLVFLLNLLAAIISYYDKRLVRSHVEIFNYSVLLSGVIYTCTYTRIKRRRALTQDATRRAAPASHAP